MTNSKSTKVTLGEVARAAGISIASASLALQNRPGVSRAKRALVLSVAEKLGYVPDARIGALMASIRNATSKELLPIGWINSHPEKDAWHKYKYLSPYQEGAREGARSLGYRLEEIWTHEPEMSMRRISQILYHRGIEAVIISHPALHFRLNWDHLAGISLETHLKLPRLHRVVSDSNYNLLLTLKTLKRLGYRRVGLCFSSGSSRVDHYGWDSEGSLSKVEKQVAAWLRRHEPEVVVGQSSHLLSWIKKAGYRVPEDIGVVHIAKDEDVSDWAGVCSHRHEIGAVAARLVIALQQNRQFGVPRVPMNTLIEGAWSSGWTLLEPKTR
jgi:LacI family transcriptional regulator